MVFSNDGQSPLLHSTMTVLEAAGLLGISRSSAYNAAKTGEIPTLKIGGRLVVPTAAIRRMLQLDGLDVVEDDVVDDGQAPPPQSAEVRHAVPAGMPRVP
jgi:excisionase family DNA binding protein